jgi:F0F1-type ATP synthase epsilon subunit
MSEILIELVIREREGIVWEGKVKSLSSTNELGDFDVLPEHAHFVSSVSKFIILVTENGQEKKIDIETGVLSVVDGKIEVYLGY